MCQQWKGLNEDAGKWKWRVYPSTGYNSVHMLTSLLLCQSESWDCCLGWKWQRAAVQVLSASWPGDKGLKAAICAGRDDYREPLMKWKEQDVLSFWSRKCDGRKSWRRTLVPTVLVVSQSQQHPDAIGDGTDSTQFQESAQERQSSIWPGEPTFRQQTGEKSRNILSSEKALISFLIWWGVACASIHQDEWIGFPDNFPETFPDNF